MPDLFDVIRNQRACRTFAPDAVPDDDITAMLEAATFAPSAENRQPWVFVVVTDAARRAQVVRLLQQEWDGGAAAYARRRLEPHLYRDVDEGIVSGIGGAPVLVVACVDIDSAGDPSAAASIFPAVQNLLLAANGLGYGSALTTLAAVRPDALAAVVGLPAHVRPMAVVPIGRPARPLGPPRRSPVAGKAHRNQYGTPLRPPGSL